MGMNGDDARARQFRSDRGQPPTSGPRSLGYHKDACV